MLPYIFHVSLLLAICYLLYRTLWEKETYFQLNRWILITCLLLSFGLPSLRVPENWSLQKRVVQQKILVTPSAENKVGTTERVIDKPSIYVAEGDGEKMIIAAHKQEDTAEKTGESAVLKATKKVTDNQKFAWAYKLSFWQIIQYIYLAGLVIFSLNFLIQLLLIIFQRQTNPTLKDGQFTIVEINQDKAPFSFGNSIFINPTKYDWDTYNQILDHEKIHIEQRHTLDILLAELVVIVQWFNPFAWFYRKAVENNLEYLTDYKMLHQGTEPEVYQLNLLRVSVPQLPLNLTTNYNQSFLKKRIAMMNVKKSSASSSWKYLLLLPLLALTVITLNPIQLQSQTDPQKTTKKKDKSFWYKSGSEDLPKPPVPPAPPAPNAPPKPPVPPTPPAPSSVRVDRHTSVTTYGSSRVGELPPVPPTPPTPPTPPMSGTVTNHTVTKSHISGDAWTREEVIDTYNQGINVNGSVEFEDEDEIVVHSGVLRINGETHDFNTSGEWKGKIEEDIQICVKLYSDLRYESRTFALGFCDRDWSPSPKNQQKGPYTLTQGAGVLTLEGDFDGRRGRGTYSFQENTAFRSYLSNEGYSRVDENLMFHFFISNIDRAFFEFLKKEGYEKLSNKELKQLAYHRMSQAKLEDYVQTLKQLGFDKPSIKELTELAIHDIDPEYIQALGRDMYEDLTLREVVEGAIHDIDPDYIRSISEMGYEDLDFREIVEFAIHDIDPEYIKDLKDSGLNLSKREIVEAAIHDVDSDFIMEVKGFGYEDLNFRDIVEFAIHDIDADYIKDLKSSGLDLSKREIVEAGIHDIDARFIKEVKAMGFDDLDFRDIVQFGIHDIDTEYIRELKAAGLEDLDKDQMVQAAIHNIDARKLAEFKKIGFDDLSFSDIIELGIHNVDAEFVQGLKNAGFPNLSKDKIVQAKIHDLDIDDIEAYRKLGFDKITIRELIDLSIHNVSPRFIKKVQDSGSFKDLDIDDYIDMKIHGMDKKMRREE